MNIKQFESYAKPKGQADCNDYGMQETADATDIMTIDQVAYRVAERNPRHKIKYARRKCHFRSFTPAVDKTGAGYYGGKTRGEEDDCAYDSTNYDQ